jgi:hypothetical protein
VLVVGQDAGDHLEMCLPGRLAVRSLSFELLALVTEEGIDESGSMASAAVTDGSWLLLRCSSVPRMVACTEGNEGVRMLAGGSGERCSQSVAQAGLLLTLPVQLDALTEAWRGSSQVLALPSSVETLCAIVGAASALERGVPAAPAFWFEA